MLLPAWASRKSFLRRTPIACFSKTDLALRSLLILLFSANSRFSCFLSRKSRSAVFLMWVDCVLLELVHLGQGVVPWAGQASASYVGANIVCFDKPALESLPCLVVPSVCSVFMQIPPHRPSVLHHWASRTAHTHIQVQLEYDESDSDVTSCLHHRPPACPPLARTTTDTSTGCFSTR
jgi:hypothetical protein